MPWREFWHEYITIIVLAGGCVFFAGVTLLVVYTKPEDAQLYGLFAQPFGAAWGALLLHLTGGRGAASPQPGSTTHTAVQSETISKTPEAPK